MRAGPQQNTTKITGEAQRCEQACWRKKCTHTWEMSFFWASCMTTFAKAMSSSSTRRSLSGLALIAKSLISFELRTSNVSESNSLASMSRGRMPSAKHAKKERKKPASEKHVNSQNWGLSGAARGVCMEHSWYGGRTKRWIFLQYWPTCHYFIINTAFLFFFWNRV